MGNNPNENMEGLAELLPEGLTEHAVDEIAKLVDSVITERVDSEVNGLITKVNGFLRMKVDEIKEYALRDLEQDEEFVRNAQIFENMKSLMSIEIGSSDKASAMSDLIDANDDAQENVLALTREIDSLMEENEKLVSIAEAINDRANFLEQENNELVEKAEILIESQQLPFESSEKAVMVSNSESDSGSVAAENPGILNEFLTPEVMRFMPIAE